MKRTITLILASVMLLSFAACSSSNTGADSSADKQNPGDTMSLQEIFDSILTDVPDLPELFSLELDDESFEGYLFIEPIENSEALASEALINAIPHSAGLLRVPDSVDTDIIAAQIETGANPRKWVCVEAEKTIVKAHGNTILLVMSSADTADAIAANFDALWA